ncbi:glycerol-3-phosphate acyltransferase [Mycoplasma phocimorsus]|uniref:glycerol-3-phosphate acyltransferase n=1 Tax=Mycoplasma phocimorsus TaxID=3045839 RepID=UPI0024BF5621|nr:glycerol-3-phosphate acyltransferase [Mycoplasma phocimorsus]MDJ1647430.1 glycerol-3-phosphate acyltransferase [Mycoplasma phocimorsus]
MEIFLSILINLAILSLGYFIGSVNFAIIFSKKKEKGDIRNNGSNNAGATNSTRVYGKKFGIIIFVLDFLKALIPTLTLGLLIYFFGDKIPFLIITQSITLGVIIGHIWPIFHEFKGGKGVSCSAVLIFSINILLLIFSVIIFVVMMKWKKIVSLAVIIVTVFCTPLTFVLMIPQITLSLYKYTYFLNNININNAWLIFASVASIYIIAAGIVMLAHRSNIVRLINKNENSFIKKAT